MFAINPITLKLILTTIFIFITIFLYAQPKDVIEDRASLLKYLKQTVFDIDTSASAIVLFEKGSFHYMGYKQVLKMEKTIKILNTNAQREGDIVIGGSNATIISDIQGTTYNLENNQIIEHSIQKRDRLSEEISDNLSVIKFSLPNVKAGSIIHYSYTKEFPSSIFLPDWNFQEEYPKLCSIYEAAVHPNIQYTVVERTVQPFKKVKRKKDLEQELAGCYQESTTDQSYCMWVKRNIAGYKTEPFMLAADNYIEMLRMNVTAMIRNGYRDPVFKDWDQLNQEYFYNNNELGGQAFNKNEFLDDLVTNLIASDTSDLAKSKHIFNYVRDVITSVNQSGNQFENIKSVFKNKTGNHRGINLLLTAMLRKAALDAEPVLLATRNNECLSTLYANISNINYMVAKVNIAQQDYFMDASQKYISFGLLPSYCYNGMARTINKNAKTVYLSADSITDKNVTIVNIAPQDAHRLSIKIDYILGNVTSYRFRNYCGGDTTTAYNQLTQTIHPESSFYTVEKKQITNLNNTEAPVKITIEGTIDLDKIALLYFNPFFDRFFAKNPFDSEKRQFPVTMDNKESRTYICNIKLPPDYVVDDYPTSTSLRYDGSSSIDFKNQYAYDKSKNTFKVNTLFVSHGTSFMTEEYSDLKGFYNQVMEHQNKNIVINKK